MIAPMMHPCQKKTVEIYQGNCELLILSAKLLWRGLDSYDDEGGDGLVDPLVLLEEVAGDEAQAQHRREHADGHHRGAAPTGPIRRRCRHHQLFPPRRRHGFSVAVSRTMSSVFAAAV